MKKTRFVTLVLVFILCIFPSIAVAQAQSDSDIDMQIFGGIGVHFILTNNTPHNATVKYRISYGLSTKEGDLWAGSGLTATRSFYPVSFISSISVFLDSGESRMIKSGILVGFFAILF